MTTKAISPVHAELKRHLILNGFTFNAEGEVLDVPCHLREVEVGVLVNEVIDFLVTSGYMSPFKITVG